jgi:hypothetical protein
MANRSELELRASAVNLTVASYPNDSKLEQAVIYAEKAVTSTATATTKAPSALVIARTSGGANV